jgi:hypothetical protein
LAGAPALAQTPVGGAKDIQNDVRGQTGRKTARIALGDQVFQNELVRTGADSLARIVFLDDTTLSVGPTSQVKLDKFVFDRDGMGKAVVFNAAKGAFRFFSGSSGHRAYRVDTPQASIGVRGTVYDVRVEPGRTLVVLVEGAVNVCVRRTARCADLTEPGQSIVVTDRFLDGPAPAGAQNWNFGAYCGADPAQSPWCNKTTRLGLDLAPKAQPAPIKRAAKHARVRVAKRPLPKHPRNPILDAYEYEEVFGAPYAPVYPVYPPVVYGGYYGGFHRGWRAGYRGGFRGGGVSRGGFNRAGGRSGRGR